MKKQAALLGALIALLSCSGRVVSQPAPDRSPREVPFQVIAAGVQRFEKPIQLGSGERTVSYDQALVLDAAVSRRAYETLPPSRQLYLYIGRVEIPVFEVRLENPEQVVLIFHAREWEDLEDGAPMVLTTDRGVPSRAPEGFDRRQDLPRFTRRWTAIRR